MQRLDRKIVKNLHLASGSRVNGSDERAAKALDEIEASVVVLDNQGRIVATNRAWRNFAADNRLPDGELPRNVDAGSNYLDVCRAAVGLSSENSLSVHDGIRAVLDGRKRSFSLEYPCHSPDRQRWFKLTVKPLRRTSPREAVAIHVDITDRWVAEMHFSAKQQELSSALAELQAMAGRIKKTLGAERPLGIAESPPLKPPPRGKAPLPPAAADMLQSLSKREMEVLVGLVRGERNVEIASRLNISYKSVSTYRSRVLEKLGMENNAQLVAWSSQTGVLRQELLADDRSGRHTGN